MAEAHVEVAVVGAGLMGASTAEALTRRGAAVALLETHGIGHGRGSSHGTERIYRRAYADPLYVGLAGRARECWRELEALSGRRLLEETGGLDSGRGRDLGQLADALASCGVALERLSAAEVRGRWPGLDLGAALWCADAGVLDPEETVAACVALAARRGADVRPLSRVTAVEPLPGDRGALVRTTTAELTAAVVVVTAGPWLPELVPSVGVPLALPALDVTQQQVFHFRRRQAPAEPWPVLVHQDGPDRASSTSSTSSTSSSSTASGASVYGLRSGADGGPLPAYKVAEHDRGTRTTASTRDGVVDAASRARVAAFVAEHLPGLDSDPVAELSCLYTTTPDEDFVLDRVGPVVVVSPCSGHGAKFAPLIGQLAADLALGGADPNPRFRLGRGAQVQ